MQQRRGRRALHPVIAVGGARHHALEQAEHAAHALDPVKRRDKMHLRGARIGEADVHAARDQCPHQTFRPVHSFCSRSLRFLEYLFEDQSFPEHFVKGFADIAAIAKGHGVISVTAILENQALTGSLLAKSR